LVVQKGSHFFNITKNARTFGRRPEWRFIYEELGQEAIKIKEDHLEKQKQKNILNAQEFLDWMLQRRQVNYCGTTRRFALALLSSAAPGLILGIFEISMLW